MLVDRDEFPSDTLPTHFMSAGAVGGLARLGVLADVEAAGFRVRALLCSPGLTRVFAHALPALLPQAFPPEAMAWVSGIARVFGAPASAAGADSRS